MAYKVRKKTKGRIVIKGVEFNFRKEVKVSKELFDYIAKTFPTIFELVNDTKPKNEAKETKQSDKKSVDKETKPKNEDKKGGNQKGK